MTIQRVLVAPLNYSHRQRGQVEAFLQVFGAPNVREFDFMAIHRQGDNPNAALLAAAQEFRPDWIWLQVQGADILHATTIGAIRLALPHCLITHWMGDLRWELSEGLAQMCKVTHATLLSNQDGAQHDLYRRAGAPRTAYVQIGLDPEDLEPPGSWTPPFRVPEVVFCGGHYGHVAAFADGTRERLGAIRQLRDKGFDVGVVGAGWPADIPVAGQCHVKQQVHVYRRAKVALSINHFNNVLGYYSDRHLIAMASGTPVVARYVPGLETEFVHGLHCFMYRDPFELESYVRRLLEPVAPHEGLPLSQVMGDAGAAFVRDHHTWRARIEGLRELAEGWRPS